MAVGGSSLTVAALARRCAYRALTLAPGGAVGRARTAGRVAPLLETVQALVGAPLYGHVVPVARGPGAGLMIVAERRSLAWLSGRVEPEVQATLVDRLYPGATFVDVGASVGFFTLLASRLVGAEGSVIAFEPQPDAVASLRRNADLNEFAMVEAVEAAVGARAGQAALRGLGQATARVVPEGDGHALPVETTTLDDHFARSPRAPAVVKIDVEGNERDVLAGMTRLLEESSPVLVVETHGTTDEVRADLACHRYVIGPLGGSHLLCVPPP
jgi:FkbM family methyltransferase